MHKIGSHDTMILDIHNQMESLLNQKMLMGPGKSDLIHLMDRLKGYTQFLSEDRYLHTQHIPLEPEDVPVQSILDELIEKYSTLYPTHAVVVHNQSAVNTIYCDMHKMQKMLFDGMSLMQKMKPEVSVWHLGLFDTTIHYQIDQKGAWVKTLESIVFVIATDPSHLSVQQSYQEPLDLMNHLALPIQSQEDLYKRSINLLVDAHYGCCVIEKALLHLVVPIALNQIRDKMMNRIVGQNEVAQTTASFAQESKLIELLLMHTTLNLETIKQTIFLIKEAHKGQKRYFGELYYTHPMAVAEILLQATKDPQVILAALLHDVVEDTEVTAAYIQSKYGSEVANIVLGVTHLADTSRKKKLDELETQEKLSITGDICAVQVKLADRIHNLMTLRCRPRVKQLMVIGQTLDFYIPLAKKMKLFGLAQQLEKECQELLKE